MQLLRDAIKVFIYALAGTTISATLFITIFMPDANLTYLLLWQFICMAAVCACGNLIYLSKKELSVPQMKIRNICHYLYICFVVLGGAFLFGWFKPGNIPQIMAIFLLNAGVYAYVSMTMFRKEERMAKDLNLRLRKINKEEEEKKL